MDTYQQFLDKQIKLNYCDGTFFDELKTKASEIIAKNQGNYIAEIVSFIDLTALSAVDNSESIQNLVQNALYPIKDNNTLHCSAVCIYPARILDAKNALKNTNANNFPIASVAAGFPSGQYHIQSRLLEIKLAIQDGATEIDAVINRTLVLENDWHTLFNEIHEMKKACEDKAKLKLILSTGELKTNENIYTASLVAMFAGSDFIKTSTGKEITNATLQSAYVMCKAIQMFYSLTGQKVGFKAAGGIKTLEQALEYKLLVEHLLGPDWLTSKLFRIGASSLLDDIRNKLIQ